MATWMLGKVMDKLIDYGFEYLQKQVTSRTDLKDMLERLRDNQPKIQAIVSAASNAQIIDQNPALNEWIWQLRDAIGEADDLFDEIEYIKHQQQLDRNKEDTKVRSNWSNISNPAKRLRVGNEDTLDLKKLEELVQKLDNIFDRASAFLHLLDFSKQEQQLIELRETRETGCLPRNVLIGRDKDKDKVINWLREPSNEEYQTHVTTTVLYRNISILSIVGHGGMGKTTLAQYVYADEMTKEFDLKMWVCVSDSFEVKKVIADMLGSVTDRSSLQSLVILQESLKSKMMSKKFLLVLDDINDIWDKETEGILYGKLEKILVPLTYGGLRSKILITTRMDSVVSMIAKVVKKKIEVLRLKGLEEDECLQLLTTHAFADAKNPDYHKNLISIARELVKKLFGSPLAVKVMGGALSSSLDERHWRNVLNSNLGHNDIFPILKLSYILLPEHLQSCFSFCSIFKQDHVFNKEDLVRMWIAVGFIQPSHNNQGETLTLEDIGKNYFHVLMKKSFFDKVNAKEYKMHDLLHELAQYVSTQECFRFVGDEKSLLLQIPKTIRHLSIETSNPEVLKNVGRFKNLKTLHITDEYDSNLLVEIFKVIRSIRLLHLNYSFALKMIPEEIGYLHHLRYLRFSVLNVKLLPRSLSTLYHLQFIISDDHVKSLSNYYFPRDMNSLFNLRYLSYCNLNFPGIGMLKFLQKLMDFNIKNEDGYRIEELEHMNELRILEIRNLNDVRAAEEADNAKLCDKRKLTQLYLYWGEQYSGSAGRHSGDSELDERVLDNLQPHNYLKTLLIQDYRGARSAIWMNEAHLINNLESIHLSDCSEWEILPPFGQLPYLKSLTLSKMPKVKRLENKFQGNDMRCVFPSLEELRIECMEALVDWFDASVVDDLFPCLTTLYLFNSPNLQELPYLPLKLESLEIRDIGWKTMNCCSISKSIPLKELEVRQCRNITSISLAGEIGKLKKLTITNCSNLISLGEERQETDATENCQLILDDLTINDPSVLQMEPLKSCTSIRSLIIVDNDELVSFPLEAEQWLLQVSSSLRELQFLNLLFLRSLPSTLTSISSLEILCICKLPRLRELPNLPPSLEKLEMKECDQELMKRYYSSSNSNINELYIKNENDCIIEELEHMNDLKDVRDAQEACKAELCDKKKLTFLSINWDIEEHGIADRLTDATTTRQNFPDPDLNERMLNNLQPLNYLKTMHIQSYMGARSAIWMNEAHLINNLEEIFLSECLEWEILPPFGQLPFLKLLWLENMPKVKQLQNKFQGNDACCVFPSLQYLCFENLEALVDWFDASVEGLFPCLTKLYLTNCPNLKELPNLPHKLETLEIDNVGWKTLNCWSISKSFRLEALEVRRCPNITSISMAGEIDKLKNLTIVDCPNLNETSISPTG